MVKTRLVKISPDVLEDMSEEGDKARREIEAAGRVIRDGGLVAFPTETVYGLGGDAFNPASSGRIYAAKGRPSDNPLIVHIADRASLDAVTDGIPDKARVLMDAFWPGPLTLIFNGNGRVPRETTGGLSTVAVRFPSDITARKLILAAGGFIAAPSANRSGRPSPTTAAHCMEDLDGLVDMVIDSGECTLGLESTIVDVTSGDDKVTLLRPGFITASGLREALGGDGYLEFDPVVLRGISDPGMSDRPGNDEQGEFLHPKAPGMKYRHYAPQGELTVVRGSREAVIARINKELARDAADGIKSAVIATDETAGSYRADIMISMARNGEDVNACAHSLFAALRRCDDEKVQRIYSEAFGDDMNGVALAVMNRLVKAAGYNIIDA